MAEVNWNDSSTLNRTLTDPQFFENAWIVAVAVTVVLMVILVWVLISFFTYWKRHRRSSQNKSTTRLLLFATIPCFVTLVRFICTETAMIIERIAPISADGDPMCEISVDITTVGYILSTASTFMFFYYRQRLLYQQPTVKRLDTCVVRFLRYSFVVLLILSSVGATLIFVYPLRFYITNFGCILRPSDETNTLIPNLMGMVVLNSSQLLLFGLFIHPLVRHCSMSADVQSESVRKRIFKAIRAATLSLFCCIFSDILAFSGVVFLAPTSIPAPMANLIYDVSLLINIVAIVLCFDNYQKILLGSYKRVKTSRVRHSTRGDVEGTIKRETQM